MNCSHDRHDAMPRSTDGDPLDFVPPNVTSTGSKSKLAAYARIASHLLAKRLTFGRHRGNAILRDRSDDTARLFASAKRHRSAESERLAPRADWSIFSSICLTSLRINGADLRSTQRMRTARF